MYSYVLRNVCTCVRSMCARVLALNINGKGVGGCYLFVRRRARAEEKRALGHVGTRSDPVGLSLAGRSPVPLRHVVRVVRRAGPWT